MLKFTLAATAALMVVSHLLVPPQAAAAVRSPGPVTMYPAPIPYPTKLPTPPLYPVDTCKGAAGNACATPLAPIAPPALQPSDPCKGVEQCASAPIQVRAF